MQQNERKSKTTTLVSESKHDNLVAGLDYVVCYIGYNVTSENNPSINYPTTNHPKHGKLNVSRI